jgi:hypothetical protein
MTDEQLIAALERAEGPDRALFITALEAIAGPEPFSGNEHVYASSEWFAGPWARFRELLNAGAWEQAAVLLVPPRMRRRVMVDEDGLASVQLTVPGFDWPSPWGDKYASEAIATCIAALRAKGAS